jgi:carbonic anhydrase/acetyltransferase-like protein (isoleucine patch superfamily)
VNSTSGFSVLDFVFFPYLSGMDPIEARFERYLRKPPTVSPDAFIASTALVVGDVTLHAHSSVWYGAVLRGDIQQIVVGEYSNIQDNAVVHLAEDYPCLIGKWVTVGHSAIVHACTVEDECLIGMGSIVLDGAVIGAQSIIGANALVTTGTVIPPGSLVLGSPGKVVRALSFEERAGLKSWAEKYVHNSAYCLKHKINVGVPCKLPPPADAGF